MQKAKNISKLFFIDICLCLPPLVFKTSGSGEQKYLPDTIFNDVNTFGEIKEIDIISPSIMMQMEIQGIIENRLSYARDDFFEFIKNFPAILVENNKLKYKYSTVAISAPDEPLERITSLKLNNKYGIEIYNKIIKPKLTEYRKTV